LNIRDVQSFRAADLYTDKHHTALGRFKLKKLIEVEAKEKYHIKLN
jgi:hypothetical protein